MADINQVITFGIGTPSGIPEFLTFGLQIGEAVEVFGSIDADSDIAAITANSNIALITANSSHTSIAATSNIAAISADSTISGS